VAKKWIAGAIKHKGALRAAAKKAGAITREGTISGTWLEKKTHAKGTMGKRARLAETLRGLRK
jgi:hypothetical protein